RTQRHSSDRPAQRPRKGPSRAVAFRCGASSFPVSSSMKPKGRSTTEYYETDFGKLLATIHGSERDTRCSQRTSVRPHIEPHAWADQTRASKPSAVITGRENRQSDWVLNSSRN